MKIKKGMKVKYDNGSDVYWCIVSKVKGEEVWGDFFKKKECKKPYMKNTWGDIEHFILSETQTTIK